MDNILKENSLPVINNYPGTEKIYIDLEWEKHVAGYSVGADLSSSPLLSSKLNMTIKRILDIFFSASVIIFILPWLTVLLFILVKINSKGPLFFFQKRNGSDGKQFTCIKFRTMIINAVADELPADEDDHRITGIGKVLRRLHIDELPQFINVFIGQMSVIGPRPYMVKENEQYEKMFAGYRGRYAVRPGITGFAQSVGNCGATENVEQLRQRIQLDIEYIRKWSFALDLKILIRTFLISIK